MASEPVILATIAAAAAVGKGLEAIVRWIVRKLIDDRDETIARLRMERDELQKENRVLRDKLFDVANAVNPVLARALDYLEEDDGV